MLPDQVFPVRTISKAQKRNSQVYVNFSVEKSIFHHDRKDAKNEFKISGKSKKGPFYEFYGLFPLFSIL